MFKILSAGESKYQCMDITEKVRKFSWRIRNFSSISYDLRFSEIFIVDGTEWRIIVFSKGYNDNNHLSIYLYVTNSLYLPSGWSTYAHFGLAIVDQFDRRNSITKVNRHTFMADKIGCGFPSFLPLSELYNPKRGFLVNDACIVEAYVSTDRTKSWISRELILKTDKTKEVECVKAALHNQKPTRTKPVEITAASSTQPSCQSVAIEPEEPTEEDMNTFFTSLESELLSSDIVCSREEAKEALAKLDEALSMTPVKFCDPGKLFPLKQAFKILASFDCSSTTLPIEQRNELLSMEESLKELVDRAAKVLQVKNHLTAKKSIKNHLTRKLECNLIRYKEAESEVKQVQQKLAALLAERKGIFRDSKEMKMELEALAKECEECEAKAKVAEDEEKIVESEWGRMKHFISSIREDIRRELEEQYGGEEEQEDEKLVPHNDFLDGPQPLEVAKEGASKVDAQAVDDPPSGRFTWTIKNFSRLNTRKHYSDIFIIGGYKWRIFIFPNGNNVDLSMYLDVADSATLPYGWSTYTMLSLAVCNQIHKKYTIRKDSQHQFNACESDWGFTSFMPLAELYDPSRGFLVNDTIVVEAEVVMCKVAD
ncbi:hypothetical protein HRI_001721600 [Hibiscus trionum]|uniref:MATH domain-containing protein n=1 Tax=Hibiscus trionum TaxID=183268 RepID=A0A9W7LXX9_HIBTR|nr:hypothetical protein HRI_001721600 [Hibiscus trionum]